jgi:hypothetical protein
MEFIEVGCEDERWLKLEYNCSSKPISARPVLILSSYSSPLEVKMSKTI